MNRREVIAATLASAFGFQTLHAQTSTQLRRVSFLAAGSGGDPLVQTRLGVFREALRKLGWIEDQTIRIDAHWGENDPNHLAAAARDLLSARPEVILASANPAVGVLREAGTMIPIVFAQISDPVPLGFVNNLAHPEGNLTGFALAEFGVGAKRLELLKEIDPKVQYIAVLVDPNNPAADGQFSAIKEAASSLGLRAFREDLRNADDIRHVVTATAQIRGSGMVVNAGPVPTLHRNLIIGLAAEHKVPAVYPCRYWVLEGGLAYYGVDLNEQYVGAANYVDRILKGAAPSELPVQFATKFELIINLKTAEALGIDPPTHLLARTDEVIE
jgi:putative ABC transport system substrate-binding protein